jgi:hypothetical protein
MFTFQGNFTSGAHKFAVIFANYSMTAGDKAAFYDGSRPGDGQLHQQHPDPGGYAGAEAGIGGHQLERGGLDIVELHDDDRLGAGCYTVDHGDTGGMGAAIASINGATSATLTSLLAIRLADFGPPPGDTLAAPPLMGAC